jgi:hypothetical protein
VGRSYGAPTLADMAKALKKFPRYSLKGAPRKAHNKQGRGYERRHEQSQPKL